MFKKLINKLYSFNIIVYITYIIPSVFYKINKPISNFYSFNILAVLGWIGLIIHFYLIYFAEQNSASGLVYAFDAICFYLITFLVLFVSIILERILSLQIKNKFITQNKFITILRYIGLLIWFVPLVYCLVVIIKMEFFY